MHSRRDGDVSETERIDTKKEPTRPALWKGDDEDLAVFALGKGTTDAAGNRESGHEIQLAHNLYWSNALPHRVLRHEYGNRGEEEEHVD